MTNQALSPDSNSQTFEYEELGITIHARLNTDLDQLRQNVLTNIKRGHEQVWPHIEQDTIIALVGGGPTLLDTLDELREAQEAGAKVVALANAAHILVENGITPSACVLLDGRPNNVNFIVDDLDCKYFVASQCDTSVFDKLEAQKRKIYIWHAINNEEEFEDVHEHYEKWVPIQGGPTIMLRGLRLFSVLGYSRFDIFGFDSCVVDGSHHAYDQCAADEETTTKIGCNGKDFDVRAVDIQQAFEFMKMVKVFGQNWQMRVHGDGLIEHLIRTTGV